MKKHTATIKDIARKLGISPSTVSRALQDHFEISEKTKQRVRQVAKELNYQPNSLALSLRNSKSHTIGVVIPEIIHFFFSTIISGIEDIAHKRGYNVIITQSNESYEREVTNVQTLYNNRVDGLLISISMETHNYNHIQNLQERGMPIVFFDRTTDSKKIKSSSVTVDDFLGGYQATQHLIKQGYTRIAHLAGPSNLFIMNERLKGYKKALKDANLPFDKDMVIYNKSMEEKSAFNATYELFKHKNPNAIFASNDVAAMEVIKAAQKYGKNVPLDLGVVGFSNWKFTQLTKPSITTIEQPGFQIGQQATEILLKQIESNETKPKIETIKLKTRLIFRESTKK